LENILIITQRASEEVQTRGDGVVLEFDEKMNAFIIAKTTITVTNNPNQNTTIRMDDHIPVDNPCETKSFYNMAYAEQCYSVSY